MNLPIFVAAAVACGYLAYALLDAGAGPIAAGAVLLAGLWFCVQVVQDLIETAEDLNGGT